MTDSDIPPKEDNVRVVVRCRPMLKDLEQNEENVIKVNEKVF